MNISELGLGIAAAAQGLVILVLVVLLALSQSSARAERRELYTRLQAGTLQDYAVQRPLLEPDRPRRQVNAPYAREDLSESTALLEREPPPESYQPAQSAFSRLME